MNRTSSPAWQAQKKIVTALTVTIIKFKAVITPPQTFKRRSTTTKPRLASYTVSGTMMGPNINKTIKGKKLLEVIKTFNSDNAEDFIEAIGKCFPQQVEKDQKIKQTHNSKYQLIDFSEFGVKILLRVSDHNINSSNIVEDIEEAYSIVFKSKKSPNTFRANNDEIDVTEYVYFTGNCTRNKYRRIAQNIYNLLGTSQWNENNVPAGRKAHAHQNRQSQRAPAQAQHRPQTLRAVCEHRRLVPGLARCLFFEISESGVRINSRQGQKKPTAKPTAS